MLVILLRILGYLSYLLSDSQAVFIKMAFSERPCVMGINILHLIFLYARARKHSIVGCLLATAIMKEIPAMVCDGLRWSAMLRDASRC